MKCKIELSARTVREVGIGCAEVDVPNGWDDVKHLVGKVLSINGVWYGFTGWNSDRLVAYFKRDASTGFFRA